MSSVTINPRQIPSFDSDDYLNEQATLQRPRCDCEECREVRNRVIKLRPKKTLKSGDETRKAWNWTVVRWDERDPESPHWRIMISCHNCGHDSFAPKTSIREIRESTWNGYCPKCVKTFGIPGKRRTLVGIHTNPFGAEINYDAPHGTNRAWVKCPNFTTCGGREEKRVDASNQDKQPFYCSECLHEQRKRPWHEKLGLKSTGRQPQGVELVKRSVGRPRRTLETDRQKLTTLLSRIHQEVTRFKIEGKRRGKVTANEVAKKLGIGSQERGGTAMMQRAVEWGLCADWHTLRDFFWDGGGPSEINFYSANKS